MKVLHSYCLNFNIGDYALGIGIKNLLRHNLDIDFIAQTNLQGREFNEYYINQVVNKLYDLLVIGGGGIIHGAHWPQGWFWLIEKQNIGKISTPFVIYGAGYNYFEDEQGIPERGIEHLRHTAEEALFFSVRNDGSKERLLEQTNIDAVEIPDPGFHIGLDTQYDPLIEGDYVIIQLADDKSELRFGGAEKRDRFILQMREVVKDLSSRLKVVLIPHVFNDIALSEAVAEGLQGVTVFPFSKYAFDRCDKVIGLYKYAKYVLAMRGHGHIVPIGFNTPVIALEAHPKARGLMEKLGLSEYVVKVNNTSFIEECNAATTKLESSYNELVSRYQTINCELLQQSNAACNEIKCRIETL
ncbi:polysaccharide pyruvyl transferase family protein [Pontiellaceae bacterium B12227]|nr:polysaccharide pyruvyl transferase family protein [Pontiellaceae bacterium B12227]